jgi:hypothetical protein
MKHSHRYRRLFASDLLKVDKETRNISYNNNRANQLNQINRLVVEKPIVEKEKVNRLPKDKAITQPQEPQETTVRRSTRTRKENKSDDYVY